ncbi:MAG TPA: hypothetical protein VHC22_02765 [Pirellulales bacterium]|nr:hypothetical protein [Pirellulales bacterium]
MKRKKRSKSRVEPDARGVEVLTVGWMLTVVTTLACEIGFAAARLMSDASDSSLMLLSQLLLFAAFVIGILALFMTPIVVRSRRLPPPPGVTVFAITVAAAPLVLAAMEMMQKR